MTANAIYLNRPLANWPRPNSLTDFVSSDHKNNKLQFYTHTIACILINIILMTMAPGKNHGPEMTRLPTKFKPP